MLEGEVTEGQCCTHLEMSEFLEQKRDWEMGKKVWDWERECKMRDTSGKTENNRYN